MICREENQTFSLLETTYIADQSTGFWLNQCNIFYVGDSTFMGGGS